MNVLLLESALVLREAIVIVLLDKSPDGFSQSD